MWAHCQVMWGNLLYELSQMKAAVGEEWKPVLDEATTKFRTAGCPEADIRQALSGHTMKDQIDLGPEPEEVTHPLQTPPGFQSWALESAVKHAVFDCLDVVACSEVASLLLIFGTSCYRGSVSKCQKSCAQRFFVFLLLEVAGSNRILGK